MQTTQGAFVMRGHRLVHCLEIAPLLAFYPGDELDPQEKKQIDAHLATCLSCAQQLREEQEILATLLSSLEAAHQMDPSGELLAQCRSELCELLDDLSVSHTDMRHHLGGAAKNGFALDVRQGGTPRRDRHGRFIHCVR